ncbi:MAG: ABC transporter permease [Thermoplasmatales archaeon B_DKE]|nr:MAG: ABC transporter permease [Thermoplasmatales archaeon B_DKE]QRF76279.1 ABC-type transport system involved in multi-copper enzyme maturation, permease component [Thermoplasmatales archaeon]
MVQVTRNFSIVMWQYFRNYYRSRSFYLMFVISLLISALMTYFTLKYIGNLHISFAGTSFNSLPSSLKESAVLYLWAFVLSYLPVFSAVFFGSPAVSSEIENKTAYHIFPLPIRRSTLLIGKFTAAVIVSYIIVSIYIVFEILSYVILFGSFPGIVFLYSYLLLLLFIISITAFTFLISSIFNKNMYAYITVFLLYYLIFNALYIILDFLYNYNAFFLLSDAASIIERVFINLNTTVPGSTSISLNGAGTGPTEIAALVMILYTVVSIAGSLILFDRKEVK